MKYEVTGDTIIIKYIADGKYKQLELNKNDNIDLDFFGQLIKAKNNKQDAMCDLYAREVLSYDPSPERITTMSLTKVEEPSDYTKKEAAKLRIEELTRDLKVVEKEIQSLIRLSHKEKRIEDLVPDYLENKETDEERFKELKVRYLQIKDLIEKEERKYDTSKSEPLTHDQLLKKVSNEFENKITKVVGSSTERRRVIEEIVNEISPKEELTKEIETLEKSLNRFNEDVGKEFEKIKNNYARNKFKKEEENSDDDLDDIDEQFKEYYSKLKFSDEELEVLKTETLTKKNILEQLVVIQKQIAKIISILNKTDIKKNTKQILENIYSKLNTKNIDIFNHLNTLENTIKEIQKLNQDNKIMYTPDTVNKVLKGVNDVLEEVYKIRLLYEQPITDEFITNFMKKIPQIKSTNILKLINVNQIIIKTDEYLQTLFDKDILLIWKEPFKEIIYSNQNLFGIAKDITKTYYGKKCKVFYLKISELKSKTFGLFKDYITTNETKFPLPIENPKLYLNLRQNVQTLSPKLPNNQYIDAKYTGFTLDQTNLSNILNRISVGYEGKGVCLNNENSGKIDLDRASTEEKLSEIIRLLQNIGYNLFTLTPNYEESERNKKLKSKGVDLRELFNKNNIE